MLYCLEHPAVLLPNRSPELRDVFHTDFRRIVKLLSGFRPSYQDDFQIVTEPEKLSEWLVATPTGTRVALDLETHPHTGAVDMVGLATSAERAILLPLPNSPVLERLWVWMVAHAPELVVHYGEGLEVEWLLRLASGYCARLPCTVRDLHKLFHAYDPEYANASESGSGSLAFIQSLYTWRPYHKHLLRQATTLQEKARYCMLDCVATWEAYHRVEERCRQEVPAAHAAYLRDAVPLLPIMVRSRLEGWHVNRAEFDARRLALQTEAKSRAQAALAHYGPAIAPKGKKAATAISIVALKKVLATQGVKLPHTAKGNASLDRKARQTLFLRHPELRLVESYFETQDTLSDCYKPGIIGPDGRVHAHASGFETSWRWRYTNPNLTQRPPQERYVFEADPGHTLVIVDTSAGEYRYFAGLTQDPNLAMIFSTYDAFPRPDNHPHVINAALLFKTTVAEAAQWKPDTHPEHRRYVFAKNYIYRLMYSYKGGIDALRDTAAKSGLKFSRADIQRLDAQWFASFPVAARWREHTVLRARESRQVMCMEWGYLRKLHGMGPDVDNVALNHHMQAGIAGVINRAIRRAWDHYHILPKVNMHDGVVWQVRLEGEAASWAERLGKLTEHTVGGVHIPVDVTVRRTWGAPGASPTTVVCVGLERV